MTFEEFLKARRVSDKAADDLSLAMSALQVRMADQLVELLQTLDIKGGKIVTSEANVAAMGEILRLLKANMNDPQWISAVSEYVASFDDVEAAALRYGSTLGDVDEGPLTAIKTHYQTSIAEYLTNPASFGRALFVPIDRTLSAAVTTGAELSSTQGALRDHIKGVGDMRGGVERTAQGAADTAITIYERSATQTIADQVGVEIFVWQGRNISTTRPYPCGEWAGHALHKKEFAEIADHEWPGKVDGTDAQTIFVFMGGWYGDRASCRHVAVPVALRDVPAGDLARMKSKGLIS